MQKESIIVVRQKNEGGIIMTNEKNFASVANQVKEEIQVSNQKEAIQNMFKSVKKGKWTDYCNEANSKKNVQMH